MGLHYTQNLAGSLLFIYNCAAQMRHDCCFELTNMGWECVLLVAWWFSPKTSFCSMQASAMLLDTSTHKDKAKYSSAPQVSLQVDALTSMIAVLEDNVKEKSSAGLFVSSAFVQWLALQHNPNQPSPTSRSWEIPQPERMVGSFDNCTDSIMQSTNYAIQASLLRPKEAKLSVFESALSGSLVLVPFVNSILFHKPITKIGNHALDLRCHSRRCFKMQSVTGLNTTAYHR